MTLNLTQLWTLVFSATVRSTQNKNKQTNKPLSFKETFFSFSFIQEPEDANAGYIIWKDCPTYVTELPKQAPGTLMQL